MYELTRKNNKILIPFEWTEQRQKAFDEIKKKMILASVITYSNFKKLFILYTDVLRKSVKVILYQKEDDKRE